MHKLNGNCKIFRHLYATDTEVKLKVKTTSYVGLEPTYDEYKCRGYREIE